VASSLAIASAILLVLYASFVAGLWRAGRGGGDARALVRLVPDCAVLLRRLAGDPRVALRYKLALVALVAYLALPIDLVPDFIPIAGQLDDVLLVALTLRWLVRGIGPQLVRALWRGTPRGLQMVLRLAYRPGG
jgi:uncharacterized membrane protein YkvA (DUF1232 family)